MCTKRVPIIECHYDLVCLKSSIVLTLEHFFGSTTPVEKVFLRVTIHTAH